jgi:hypothetical protein
MGEPKVGGTKSQPKVARKGAAKAASNQGESSLLKANQAY